MSKRITIANSEVISNSQTGVADSFYAALGSWTQKESSLVFEREANLPIRVVSENVEIINATKTSSILETGYRVTLQIQPTDVALAADILDSIVLNQRYQDYSAQVVVPDSFEDVFNQNRDSSVPASPDVAAKYTFIRENIEYENINLNVSNELLLPNYYEPRTRNVKNKNSYIKIAKNTLEQSAQEREVFTNIFVPPESISDIEQSNALLDETSQYSYEIEDLDYTSEIPFLVRLKLKDTNGDIDQKEDFVKFRDNFLFYQDRQDKDPQEDVSSLLMRWHLQNASSFIGQNLFSYTNNTSEVTQENLSSYSLLNWLNDFAPARVGDLPNDIEALKFFTTDVPSLDLAINNYDNIIDFTKTLNRFATKYVEEYVGSTDAKRLEDVLAGIPAKTEILYYKVDKFEGASPVGTPLQTILIPNTKESIDYLDTQVIYGKQYTYRISYMVAIHGCEYEYVSLEENDDGSYNLTANSYPSIRIIELPVFTSVGSLLTQPPLTPRVEIVPIRRQRNKVKIVFYSGYGNEQEKPISLSSQDRAFNSALYQNNFLTSKEGLLEHTSFSSVGQFEIYRSPSMPIEDTNYSSFVDNLFSSVSTTSADATLLADSAAIVLELQTNKKYYFCFVARNRLGLASNPTRIFEMMYTNQDGISRLQYQELVTQNKEQSRREVKTLTKLINISPTFQQVYPNLEESSLVDNEGNPLTSKNKSVFLGNTEDNMFGLPGTGKKFKFRFRSKKTNKVFDINLTCVNTKVETEFDRTSNSISLAVDELPVRSPPTENNLLYGAVELPAINISNFKNYDILENQNITSRLKRIVPINDAEEVTRDPVASQSEQINDIFPINN